MIQLYKTIINKIYNFERIYNKKKKTLLLNLYSKSWKM